MGDWDRDNGGKIISPAELFGTPTPPAGAKPTFKDVSGVPLAIQRVQEERLKEHAKAAFPDGRTTVRFRRLTAQEQSDRDIAEWKAAKARSIV
ncbi:hypothetical protein [Mesorhizobium sp. B2-4-17]|uniref:hypothetical protein n=1 Tax=Mesorhizobium sp. B2-4-17 TaxID=2589932 RepID=UPI00112A3C36|nr:hypothetical protein [Mesorhizobium sp. B2-4-17]TPK85317.1 hypothetical protein FJ548_17400 [Mesorhizobium sp. B2-4-17]